MAEDYPSTLAGFEQRFNSDEACRVYLVSLRWPGGFVCPRCESTNAWEARRNLMICRGCGYEASVMAGTIFQDTHLPLRTWFRAMWYVTSQKNGASALGLQRVLGLGSYKTAWAMLHKLRRAMVRPGRERLHGKVEVDEAYWGSEEEGVRGRLTHTKTLIAVAAQDEGSKIGRSRMRQIPDAKRATLHGFIAANIEPGSTVRTDGLNAYLEMQGYTHDRGIQRNQESGTEPLLPKVHLVISLFKRWLLGTHQGAVGHAHLDYYIDEFVFRFNRRTSSSRGKLFYRLAQQAVQVQPAPFATLTKPLSVGVVGVK